MAYFDTTVKCSNRYRHRCRGITLDKDYVRPSAFQNIIHTLENSRSKRIQRMSLQHNIELVIRIDTENVEQLLKHLPVLARGADYAGQLRAISDGADYWRHLNG